MRRIRLVAVFLAASAIATSATPIAISKVVATPVIGSLETFPSGVGGWDGGGLETNPGTGFPGDGLGSPLDLHFIAEPPDASGEAIRDFRLVAADEVVCPEIAVKPPVPQEVVGSGEHRGGDSDDGFFGPRLAFSRMN